MLTFSQQVTPIDSITYSLKQNNGFMVFDLDILKKGSIFELQLFYVINKFNLLTFIYRKDDIHLMSKIKKNIQDIIDYTFLNYSKNIPLFINQLSNISRTIDNYNTLLQLNFHI